MLKPFKKSKNDKKFIKYFDLFGVIDKVSNESCTIEARFYHNDTYRELAFINTLNFECFSKNDQISLLPNVVFVLSNKQFGKKQRHFIKIKKR